MKANKFFFGNLCIRFKNEVPYSYRLSQKGYSNTLKQIAGETFSRPKLRFQKKLIHLYSQKFHNKNSFHSENMDENILFL